MITPSTISKKPAVVSLEEQSTYNFPEQIRDYKNPLIAGQYTFGSMQTYGYTGLPSDSRGDFWD